MGGKSEPQTQTTKYELSPEQRQIMGLAMPGLESFAATVPQRYPGSTVAGFDPAQTSGQQMVLDAAGNQKQIADRAQGQSNFLMSDIWNPASNPGLQGAIDASIRPITEKYQEVVKPGLRDEFTGAGQVFGGSQRAKAEEAGARDYLRNVGDTSSKLVQDQYANNLAANVKALALAPQTQQMQLAPGLATSGVGDVRQALSQAMLDSGIAGFNYDQLAPFLQSKELMSLLQGLPGGSTTTVASAPQRNQTMAGLGGAASGASLGSMFGPVGTGVGALGGGLLGYFG